MNKSGLLVLLFICVSLTYSENVVSYENYKVWEITPENIEHLNLLREWEQTFELDFWEKSSPGSPSRVMVSPSSQDELIAALKKHSIPFTLIIDNVERVFEREREQLRSYREKRKMNPRHTVDFEHFWGYDEMNEYMDDLAEEFPDRVEKFFLANSTHGRPIYGLKYSINDGLTGERPIIYFDAGVHAREWISNMQAIYIIHELIEHYDHYEHMLQYLDFIIIPTTNPDGLEHSRDVNRMWRKTRSINIGSTCVGTDGNRNYDIAWNPGRNPCSETYGGASAFSEPEIAGIREVLHEFTSDIKLYISFHSYGNMLLYPFSYETEPVWNWEQQRYAGQLFANAVLNATGTIYRVGTSPEILYSSYGTSKDYAAINDIDLAYTIELPGGGTAGFDIEVERIDEVVKETFIGLHAMLHYVVDYYYHGNHTSNEV